MTIGRVSPKQALALLDARGDRVSQSALSRYVAKYADALKPRREGGQILLDFDRLCEHRDKNLRGAVKTPGVDQTEPAPATLARRIAPDKPLGRADEAARNIRAQRLMRELELAKRTGQVTPILEVEESAAAAVAALKSAFALALNDTAAAISRAAGVEPLLVRPFLRAFESKGLAAFVRSLRERGVFEEETAPAE